MTTQKHTAQQVPPVSKPVTEDAILKVAKEVIIKFIEVGRLSPGSFAETFDDIYNSVRTTVKNSTK